MNTSNLWISTLDKFPAEGDKGICIVSCLDRLFPENLYIPLLAYSSIVLFKYKNDNFYHFEEDEKLEFIEEYETPSGKIIKIGYFVTAWIPVSGITLERNDDMFKICCELYKIHNDVANPFTVLKELNDAI
jgi:hypothetical protein